MAEEKGLKKPVKLKAELAAMLGEKELPRTQRNFGTILSLTSFKLKLKMVLQKMLENILLPIQHYYLSLKIQNQLVSLEN